MEYIAGLRGHALSPFNGWWDGLATAAEHLERHSVLMASVNFLDSLCREVPVGTYRHRAFLTLSPFRDFIQWHQHSATWRDGGGS